MEDVGTEFLCSQSEPGQNFVGSFLLCSRKQLCNMGKGGDRDTNEGKRCGVRQATNHSWAAYLGKNPEGYLDRSKDPNL